MLPDHLFLQNLKRSQAAVNCIGSYLADLGAEVFVRPLRIRPERNQWQDYSDEGDIEIRLKVEVKHRTLDFTNVDDYPYPTVLINAARLIDSVPSEQLYAYYIVNKAITHAIVIKPDTRKHWLKTVKRDKRYEGNQEVEFYEIDKRLVKFVRIADDNENL